MLNIVNILAKYEIQFYFRSEMLITFRSQNKHTFCSHIFFMYKSLFYKNIIFNF